MRSPACLEIIAQSYSLWAIEEMNVVQITPGAGGMYCGNCLRDNALVVVQKKEQQKAAAQK